MREKTWTRGGVGRGGLPLPCWRVLRTEGSQGVSETSDVRFLAPATAKAKFRVRPRGLILLYFLRTDFRQKGEATIAFFPSLGGSELVISAGNDSIRAEDIKSIWYRRPNHFNLPIKDPVQKDYAEKEVRLFLDAVWFLLEQKEHIFFLSRPSAIERARRKLFQLDLAGRYGMRIPKTIVTNDPKKVMEFHEFCPRGMIFKAANHEFLNYGEKSYNIPTTLLTDRHLQKIDLIRRAPAMAYPLIFL